MKKLLALILCLCLLLGVSSTLIACSGEIPDDVNGGENDDTDTSTNDNNDDSTDDNTDGGNTDDSTTSDDDTVLGDDVNDNVGDSTDGDNTDGDNTDDNTDGGNVGEIVPADEFYVNLAKSLFGNKAVTVSLDQSNIYTGASDDLLLNLTVGFDGDGKLIAFGNAKYDRAGTTDEGDYAIGFNAPIYVDGEAVYFAAHIYDEDDEVVSDQYLRYPIDAITVYGEPLSAVLAEAVSCISEAPEMTEDDIASLAIAAQTLLESFFTKEETGGNVVFTFNYEAFEPFNAFLNETTVEAIVDGLMGPGAYGSLPDAIFSIMGYTVNDVYAMLTEAGIDTEEIQNAIYDLAVDIESLSMKTILTIAAEELTKGDALDVNRLLAMLILVTNDVPTDNVVGFVDAFLDENGAKPVYQLFFADMSADDMYKEICNVLDTLKDMTVYDLIEVYSGIEAIEAGLYEAISQYLDSLSEVVSLTVVCDAHGDFISYSETANVTEGDASSITEFSYSFSDLTVAPESEAVKTEILTLMGEYAAEGNDVDYDLGFDCVVDLGTAPEVFVLPAIDLGDVIDDLFNQDDHEEDTSYPTVNYPTTDGGMTDPGDAGNAGNVDDAGVAGNAGSSTGNADDAGVAGNAGHAGNADNTGNASADNAGVWIPSNPGDVSDLHPITVVTP